MNAKYKGSYGESLLLMISPSCYVSRGDSFRICSKAY